MKFDELLAEQSTKPVTKGTRQRAAKPANTPRNKNRKDTPAPPRKPLTSRAEVLEAVQLLSGGNVRVSSINGGKAKKEQRRG